MRIAVHLHLAYLDQTKMLLDYLSNLSPYQFDLFVTLLSYDIQTINAIKKFKSDAFIYVVPNKGFDVGPFCFVLNQLDLDKYDYLIKIHTKGAGPREYIRSSYIFSDGAIWGKSLLDAVLLPHTLKSNIKRFESDGKLGMLGAKECLFKDKKYKDASLIDNIPKVMMRIGLPLGESTFIVGTMFMVRSSLLKPLQRANFVWNDFEETYRVCIGTIAHAIERVLGMMIVCQGYKLEGVPSSMKFLFKQFVFRWNWKLSRFIFSKGRTGSGHDLIKVFKIPVSHKLSNELKAVRDSALFDADWYKRQYASVLRSYKYTPEAHYLTYGWKANFNPSSRFDTEKFLKEHPDVKKCPLLYTNESNVYEN